MIIILKRILKPLLFALILILLSCAGKGSRGQIITRFIPDDKRTIYISTIPNYTDKADIENELYDYLVDHYKYYGELVYTGSLQNTDVILKSKITKYLYTVTEFYDELETEEKKIRIYMKAIFSLQNRTTKEYYVENKNIESSTVFMKEKSMLDPEKDARNSMYKTIIESIDELIRTGNLPIYTPYGYEDLKKNENDLFFSSDKDKMNKTKEEKAKIDKLIKERDEKGTD